MNKYRTGSSILLLCLIGLGYFLVASERPNARFPFRYGLDLVGGTELIYRADTSQVSPSEISDSMSTLRDVIERRVNIFGVSEPLIQVEEAGLVSGNSDHRLIVELPGVSDIDEAVALIGQTPALEFMLEKPGIRDAVSSGDLASTTVLSDMFIPTGLTGRLLEHSSLQFNPTTREPEVTLNFNEEGRVLLTKITSENVGKVLAIVLDGRVIQAPVIQSVINTGEAQISGAFTPEEARETVRELNYGALPLPIELVSTETVGASLGGSALKAGVRAGFWGIGLVILFMIIWYRLPGFLASVALVLYVALSLVLFKLIPVTLTAAGVAGFILSIGMAVDANILIFERMKEELLSGKKLNEAMREGFHRAWLSIRDSNVSSIITAIILFWLGTSAVKGFALTLGVGVFVSMFTAITASRTFLFAFSADQENRYTRFLFGSGVRLKRKISQS